MSLRRTGVAQLVAAVAALAWLGSPGAAHAQVMTRPLVAPAVGAGVVPTGISGFVGMPGLGLAATAPAAVGLGATSPYALSTVGGGYNPYTGIGSLGTTSSPYSLSTSPYGNGGGYYGGSGWYYPDSAGPGIGVGYALQGYASAVRAEGQYFKDIQSARISREESRQAQIETARRLVQYRMWLDSVRPTVPKLREHELALELDRIRKDASDGDITSGRALNVLLKSILGLGTSKLHTGPRVELEEDALKRINLTDGSSSGNVGLLKSFKDAKKLAWPEALQDEAYREPEKKLESKLAEAVRNLNEGGVPVDVLRDIRAYYKEIADKLNDTSSDLHPDRFTEARRYLNQLNAAIRALSDPNVAKFFNNTWNAKGKRVAELVEFMSREGLTFTSSTPGDEAAYRALYQAMRQFESGLQLAQR